MEYSLSLFDGTSLIGYINADYDRLAEVFGKPEYCGNDKSQVGWNVIIDGVVCTIYDWKISGSYRYNTCWNICGKTNEAKDKIFDALFRPAYINEIITHED
jgi:hypothetical protein